MLDNNVSGLPVTNGAGHVVGIVTEHDLLRGRGNGSRSQPPHWLQLMSKRSAMGNKCTRFHEATADDVMTRDPVTVAEETPIEEVCRLIGKHGIKRVPVVRDGKLVGILARAEEMMAELQRESMLHRTRSQT